MLSPQTRRELEAERQRLRKILQALDQILGDQLDQTGPVAQARQWADIRTTNNNGSLSELGLREAARKVLEAAFPQGLKPQKVAEEMERRDFRTTSGATTPLVTRVRNELWRMAQKGDLTSNRGVYTLVRQQLS